MFDFIIFSLPRSGSHMLASALDSHPDICCTGEHGMREKFPIGRNPGKVTGCIIQAYHVANGRASHGTKKIIRLTRALTEIAASRHYESVTGTSAVQYLTPVERSGIQHEPTEPVVARLRGLERVLDAYVGRLTSEKLIVSYQDLCKGEDARVLDPGTSEKLCDFLGVDRMPLKPSTFKPS